MLGNREIELINVHLFHDDINTTAIEQIPSSKSVNLTSLLLTLHNPVYSVKREAALHEAVTKCLLSESTPAFLFGYKFKKIKKFCSL